MPRYFIEISYCGKTFNGWQVQPNAVTVQGEIERAISLLLREKINIVGAGRTDTGVHARYYVAHFDTNSSKDVTSSDFKYHLNAVLDDNIVVHTVTKVKDDAHARFDAVSREYKYYVSPTKNPFARDFSYQYYRQLDVQKMNDAAALILDYEDFTSFAKIHTDVKTNNCDVTVSEWAVEGDMLVYTVRANRFLRNMVRALVGTMLECGQGKLTTEQFREVIEAKHRSKAGSSARPEGLFLTDVEYPYFDKMDKY